ncbi:MAG: M23 family metallopeptidase [Desulfovibrio sp.]|jgi:murein DD-endopeptidase MepM/ murein hydrolase activator NlpD|nr:M23 family metallopeptidase [Desulfovibrio sp.]
MLLGKYHIVIFKEGRSGSRNLRLRGWFGIIAFILVTAIVVCNVWLARQWLESLTIRENLKNAERLIDDQRRQLVNLTGKIGEVSADLQRLQRFDGKLRIMMNMDKEPVEVGSEGDDFFSTYLPLHRQELAARKLHEFLTRLGESVRLEEVSQQDIMRVLRENRSVLASMPTIWPAVGFVSSTFGRRSSPFSRRAMDFHKGLDISNRIGTPVVSTAQGNVSFTGPDGAYGNSVEINHGGGIVTKYAHLQRYVVKPGQWVKRGEVIGYIGMTGRTTGPHLHYEVRRNGVPVNPMRYILN